MSDSEEDEKIKVRVENLAKIFGPHPDVAVEMLEQDLSKQEIFEKTGNTVGLAHISFSVKKGETFVLMGLSGSGKSTLLRCINRLIPPTSGTVYIDDEDVTALDDDQLRELRRHKMGMVFQRFALLPHRNVRDNVAFGLEIQGVPEEERHAKAEDAIELVGLSGYGDARVTELSGGMQQRVGLARALVHDPDILLMDEPFSALDPLIRREMQDELIDLQERLAKTIIFVTHDLDEALKLGDRIALMKDGYIVQLGTAEEILTNPQTDYVRQFVADVDMSKVLNAKDIMRRPEPLVSIDAGPNMALHLMEEFGISSVFVVGKNRRFLGMVTVDDAVRAKKEGKALRDILRTEVYKVEEETPISDIIPMLATCQYPVAVLGEEGKMRGIIMRASVLAGLSRKEVDEYAVS